MKKSIFSALAAGVICVSAGCQNTQNVQEKESMKRSYTPPFKNANVSYTANKITKNAKIFFPSARKGMSFPMKRGGVSPSRNKLKMIYDNK